MNIYTRDVCDMNTLITASVDMYWLHLFNMTWMDANLFGVHQSTGCMCVFACVCVYVVK